MYQCMKKFALMFMMLVMAIGIQAQELKKGDSMPKFELKSSVYGNVKPADLKGIWQMGRVPEVGLYRGGGTVS